MSSLAIWGKIAGRRKERFSTNINKGAHEARICMYCFASKKVFISAAMVVITLCVAVTIRDVVTLHKLNVHHSAGPVKKITRSSRSKRFPSVNQRVQLYMSDWYLPRCQEEGDDNDQLFRFTYNKDLRTYYVKENKASGEDLKTHIFSLTNISVDTAFSLDYDTIFKCNHSHSIPTMQKYCFDVLHTVFPAIHNLGWNATDEFRSKGRPPILFQFGDKDVSLEHGYLKLPIVKKFRTFMSRDQINLATLGNCSNRSISRNTSQAIIWKLNTERHYGNLQFIPKIDIQWKKKKNRAVFRASLSGYERYMNDHEGYNTSSFLQQCLWTPRCQLVYQYSNSTLINAKLKKMKYGLPSTINGVRLNGPKLSIKQMLSYKALIFLEGNDVSSGLKWGLYSKSVVLMPRPIFTSWAMEELLEPWVHYVPIKEDLSDVEEKIQWVLNNGKKACQISQRATQWMDDLVFHPDAETDDKKIYQEILQRYSTHWYQDSSSA